MLAQPPTQDEEEVPQDDNMVKGSRCPRGGELGFSKIQQ
jgi:CxxC motif-containing protein